MTINAVRKSMIISNQVYPQREFWSCQSWQLYFLIWYSLTGILVLKSVKTSPHAKKFREAFSMCCIVAFDPNKSGCFAIQQKYMSSLMEFWDELNQLVGHKPIEIVAIGRPMRISGIFPLPHDWNRRRIYSKGKRNAGWVLTVFIIENRGSRSS